MRIKKIFAITISVVMIFGIAGCGSRTVSVSVGESNEDIEETEKATKKATEKNKDKNIEKEDNSSSKKSNGKEENDSEDTSKWKDNSLNQAELNTAELVSGINYCDSDGKLLYYASYAYYDNGLLCSETLHTANYYGDDYYVSDNYTILYLYDDNGNLKQRILDTLSLDDTYDSNSGKIVLDYIYDDDGNSTELVIYPENETIEDEKFGVDKTKTEELYGDAPIIYADSKDEWAKTYSKDVFESVESTDLTVCRLMYVNDDYIPEIWVDYGYGYAGAELYTVYNGKIDSISFSHGYASCIEKQNLLAVTSGSMGNYEDRVYEIEQGKFKLLARGYYGVDFSDDNVDENGEYMYIYHWNEEDVTEDEYDKNLADAFDDNKANDINQNIYSFEQCKLLMEALK